MDHAGRDTQKTCRERRGKARAEVESEIQIDGVGGSKLAGAENEGPKMGEEGVELDV